MNIMNTHKAEELIEDIDYVYSNIENAMLNIPDLAKNLRDADIDTAQYTTITEMLVIALNTLARTQRDIVYAIEDEGVAQAELEAL